MLTLNLSTLSPADVQSYLQHAIAPRPICFASTIDKEGNVNLSPFSFFNLFSSNPPIVIFSPSRRVRDNSIKHTLQNVLEVPEVVINMVDYAMVQQMSLASCEFSKTENEFIKAGFTPENATLVKPPMVKESKVKLECKVLEIKALGAEGGAGNLVICEVLCMHVDKNILDSDNRIDQTKYNLVARLGGDWYCKISDKNLFKVAKPNIKIGIGIDSLPEAIRNSKILSGNHLGQLANVNELPIINPAFENEDLKQIVLYFNLDPNEMETETHKLAASLLNADDTYSAWQVLLANDII